jgi:hypothetical protein
MSAWVDRFSCDLRVSMMAVIEMSAMGQKQTSRPEISMSALPLKADIAKRDRDVR